MKKFLLQLGFLLGMVSFAKAQQAVSLESSAVAIESVAAAKDSLKANTVQQSLQRKKVLKTFLTMTILQRLLAPVSTQGP